MRYLPLRSACTVNVVLACAILLFANISVTFAQSIVYNNNDYTNAVVTFDMSNFAQADDFTLTSPTAFNGIRLWVTVPQENPPPELLPGFSGTLSWFIYSNDSGQPGTVIDFGSVTNPTVTNTGASLLNFPEFRIAEVQFLIPTVSLPSNTYWLSIKEGLPFEPFDETSIFWVATGTRIGSQRLSSPQEVNPTTWNVPLPGGGNFDKDLSFQLLNIEAAAPEPAPVALFGATLLLLGIFRRRRSRLPE